MPFLSRLDAWAQESPRRQAVRIGHDALTWEELRSGAAALLTGVPDGGYTLLQEPNSLEFILRWVAGVSGTRRCVVLDAALPDDLSARIREEVAAHWGAPDALATHADRGRAAVPGTSSRETVVVHHAALRGGELADGPADTPFLLALTSGTASLPKAIVRTRASWQASFVSSTEFFGLTRDEITLAPGPLSSGLGLYALSECLHAGAEFRTLQSFDVDAVHDAVEHDGVTRLVLVPSMLRELAERGILAGSDATSLRSIVVAGAKLDPRTLEAARRWASAARIHEYYGAQELSFVSGSRLSPKDPLTGHLLASTSVGRPFPGVSVAILDPDGDPLPDGQTGSIAVRSGMVGDGYLWGDQKDFVRIGDWATVHDQGFLRDGELHFLGRASDMIESGGLVIHPQEIEKALGTLPGVEFALVTGVDDPLRGERLIAAVRTGHRGLGEGQLRMGLADLVDPRMLPEAFHELREVPLTARGKVSRALLRDWILDGDPRVPRLPV
ncbi:class I adenylate-forming enzyme family protein [Arthrobacter sp. Y-9]|uniref:class I adenylate-forming enzyme family protein n=1 Tax=Arthrobacter sp. Y-9 TaxID=3039385 RepID=UPI00242019BE|nr:class I adenylate-forming enzyme family protein [Arthrobacter sp. Y-9]WFR82675.1 class I adenylate-forming enzyme family protein [Arthrobacter sp. Y-9]